MSRSLNKLWTVGKFLTDVINIRYYFPWNGNQHILLLRKVSSDLAHMPSSCFEFTITLFFHNQICCVRALDLQSGGHTYCTLFYYFNLKFKWWNEFNSSDLLDLLSYVSDQVSELSRVIIRLAMDTFVNYKVAFIQIFILL